MTELIWTLWTCIGVTWAGCGAVTLAPMPSAAACYEAIDKTLAANRKDGAGYIVQCKPYTIGELKKRGIIE